MAALPDERLAAYLARWTPGSEERTIWLDGQMHLRLWGYLADELPPLDFITSARCLVLKDAQVLVQRDIGSTHILPGGRLEAGETPLQAARREVLEETGWTIKAPLLLGFLHFLRLTPKPPDVIYPHADFLQVVYLAQAGVFVPEARLDDGHELESSFRSLDDVQRLPLPPGQRLFLEAMLQQRTAAS